jgi:hypothetical protein
VPIPKALRQLVRERAGNCCEYCRLPATAATVPFHVDHIMPEKHGGLTHLDSLCLACATCNTYKGHDLTGIDPVTGNITPLYHPRKQVWDEHFEIQTDMIIAGRTPEGRTTARVLQMNTEDRVDYRQILAELGEYPSKKSD